MTPSFVMDASVAAGWLMKDERSVYAIAAIERIVDKPALAPAFMLIEFGNILRTAERKGRIIAHERKEYMDSVLSLEMVLEPLHGDTVYVLDILTLACEQELTTYDAIYLEAALRHELPLATLDKDLQRAAQICGVEIFRP